MFKGFLSYVHADDDAEGGRIAQLGRDIKEKYEMLTGEELDLFLDQDRIKWGDRWRHKIDEGLGSVAFFIPVMTPRYFSSGECRRELRNFAERAAELGVRELVLPLLYENVPALGDESSDDDMIERIKEFHWEDWSDLKFFSRESEEYRRGVARLAERLKDANLRAEEKDASRKLCLDEDHPTDDSPGVIDELASSEESMRGYIETVQEITDEVERVGRIFTEATHEVKQKDARGATFAARLLVARRVARELAVPADRIHALGNEFATQLHEIDRGIRLIIARAPSEVADDPKSMEGLCSFFISVCKLSVSISKALESARTMSNSSVELEKISRDMRPALRRLRQGLTSMDEVKQLSDEWIELIRECGIECEGLPLE